MTNPTRALFPDKQKGADCPFTDTTKCGRYSDWNALKGAALDLRAEALAARAHASGWVNVKEAPYGAKGDGTTDDTAAFQAALDATPAGGITIAPPSTYLVGLLNIPNKVTLVGAGRWTTLLAKANQAYVIRPAQIDNTGGYCQIAHLTINGGGHTFSEAVVSWQAQYAGSSVKDVIVYNNAGGPAFWFGPGTAGDGIAGVVGEDLWAQTNGTIGVYVSSDYPVSMGGNGYEGIISQLMLNRVQAENSGANPGIKVYAKSQNHVRALDVRSLWVGGYTDKGLVLDGVTGSLFSGIYSDQSGTAAAALVHIPTPTNGDTSPVKGLEFHSIVSRNSATPALKDDPRGYAPDVTDIQAYSADGTWRIGSDVAIGPSGVTAPAFLAAPTADHVGFKLASIFLAAQTGSGAYQGIWFGGNASAPSITNYGVLYNPGADGTYLNGGAQSGLRVGNDSRLTATATGLNINTAHLPTSASGLASGDLWLDTANGNVLKVAP